MAHLYFHTFYERLMMVLFGVRVGIKKARLIKVGRRQGISLPMIQYEKMHRLPQRKRFLRFL